MSEWSEASGERPARKSSAEGPARWIERRTPVAGTELASYRISSGERLLICSQAKWGLEIFDVSIDFSGPTYRVERALEDGAALWAVVDDYLDQARQLDAPPMSGEAITSVMFRRSDD